MSVIQVVLPECSSDDVSEGLRQLTKAVSEHLGGDPGFGLGGLHGYGEDFENDTFALHRYCWCDENECPWCGHNAPNFLHKPTGATVHWYKYIGRSMKITVADWPAIFRECEASIPKGPANG